MSSTLAARLGHRFIVMGILLFLVGLLTGLLMPLMENPRMGLSSHLEGVMNGMFLVLLGLVWPRLTLPSPVATGGFWLATIGAYANWVVTLSAAFWGAGAPMMPLAGQGMIGTDVQEMLLGAGLMLVVITMVLTCAFVLWGLRKSQTAKP